MTIPENKKTVRSSNYELLRILLMVMILAGHFVSQSGAMAVQTGANRIFTYILAYSPRIAVNGFLMLGCFFMAGSGFRSKRIITIWLQEFFYAVGITAAVYFAVPGTVSLSNIAWAAFPIFNFNVEHWYVSVYLTLMFIAPFLQKITELSEKYLRSLSIVLLVFVSLWSTFHGMEDVYLDCLAWFVCVFIFMSYAKKYLLVKLKGKWRWLFISVGTYALFVAVILVNVVTGGAHHKLAVVADRAATMLLDYKSLPNLFIAFTLFVFFSKLEIKPNKAINYVGGSTLAVYIVHQTTALSNILWIDILHADLFAEGRIWPVYVLGVIAAIFAVVTLADKLRVALLETPIANSRPVGFICKKIDGFYTGIDGVKVKEWSKEETRFDWKNVLVTAVLLGALTAGVVLFAGWGQTASGDDGSLETISLSGMSWNADKYITSGISKNEKVFTWTDGKEVEMKPIDVSGYAEGGKGLALVIDVADTYNGGQKVLVYQDDALVYEGKIEGEGQITAPLNDADILNIRIELPDAVSPAESEGSGDDRVLALQLTKISLVYSE